MSTLSARHGWIIRKDDGVSCTCATPNPRHLYGYQCFTPAEVARFKAEHDLRDEGHARSLLFIETFKPRLKFGVERPGR